MLREDPSSITPERGFPAHAAASANGTSQGEASRAGSVDIQQELNRLEEMLLASPRVFGRTWVQEDQLLEQLDLVRLGLPEAFHEAEAIVSHKEEILYQAEQYAQDIIQQAELRAAQILNELGIIRQAEMEAQQIRQQVHQECELAKDQTLAEIERLRHQAKQELEQMQQMTLAECEEIQNGADDYADRVLTDMEAQLAEMLRVIRNGRQQLQPPEPPRPSAPTARTSSPKGDRLK